MKVNFDDIYPDTIQTIIIDSNDINLDENIINKLYNTLKSQGSLFLLSNYSYENGVLTPTGLQVAQKIKNQKFFLRNTIVWIVPENKFSHNGLFLHRYRLIFHFTKVPREYVFNKNPIREKHIWEKIEWGKRRRNYNPLGKDPGNVWIKTEDDGHAHITKHIPLNKSEVIERFILLTSLERDKILLLMKDNECRKLCEKHERIVVN